MGRLVKSQVASIDKIFALLEPLVVSNGEGSSGSCITDFALAQGWGEINENPVIKAKILVTLGYAVNAVSYTILKLLEDSSSSQSLVKDHPVMKELERMRIYMKKIAEIERKPVRSTTVNSAAAARFVRSALFDPKNRKNDEGDGEGDEDEKEKRLNLNLNLNLMMLTRKKLSKASRFNVVILLVLNSM